MESKFDYRVSVLQSLQALFGYRPVETVMLFGFRVTKNAA